jgi:hypothetical protein
MIVGIFNFPCCQQYEKNPHHSILSCSSSLEIAFLVAIVIGRLFAAANMLRDLAWIVRGFWASWRPAGLQVHRMTFVQYFPFVIQTKEVYSGSFCWERPCTAWSHVAMG